MQHSHHNCQFQATMSAFIDCTTSDRLYVHLAGMSEMSTNWHHFSFSFLFILLAFLYWRSGRHVFFVSRVVAPSREPASGSWHPQNISCQTEYNNLKNVCASQLVLPVDLHDLPLKPTTRKRVTSSHDCRTLSISQSRTVR